MSGYDSNGEEKLDGLIIDSQCDQCPDCGSRSYEAIPITHMGVLYDKVICAGCEKVWYEPIW